MGACATGGSFRRAKNALPFRCRAGCARAVACCWRGQRCRAWASSPSRSPWSTRGCGTAALCSYCPTGKYPRSACMQCTRSAGIFPPRCAASSICCASTCRIRRTGNGARERRVFRRTRQKEIRILSGVTMNTRISNSLMLVDGKWEGAADGRLIQVENLAKRTIIGEVPRAGAAEVDRAVRAAAKAFESWKLVQPRERGRLLMKIADAMDAESEAIGRLIATETGNALRTQSRPEAKGAADLLRY